MKNCLFVAVVLAAWYARAQPPLQPKSNDQAAQAQSAAQPAQPQSAHAPQSQADGSEPSSNNNVSSDKNAASGKDAAQPKPAGAPATGPAASKGCLAVKPVGSHAFRNIMLAGVAGALISKQQYKVMDVVNYPVSVGTKFHGDDLQTISSNGTKVVILDKHSKEEDLQKACH